MTINAELALNILRDPHSGATKSLASLIIKETLRTPISEVASAEWLATQLSAGLDAATTGDTLRGVVQRHLDELKTRVKATDSPPRDWLPKEVEPPLRDLLGRHWSPNERITYRIIDQGVFHDLLKEVLETSIRRFSTKARRFDQNRLGGFGKHAKKLGKGLFGGIGKNVTGAAESLIAGVSEEFEAVFERHIEGFLEGASTEALKVVAAHLCDPEHASAYGDLRNAILDVLLDTPIGELVEEFDKLGPIEAVDTVIAATRVLISRPDFIQSCTHRIAQLQAEAGDGTFEHWLTELGMTEIWESSSTELLNLRIDAVVQTAPFKEWWLTLFESGSFDEPERPSA